VVNISIKIHAILQDERDNEDA